LFCYYLSLYHPAEQGVLSETSLKAPVDAEKRKNSAYHPDPFQSDKILLFCKRGEEAHLLCAAQAESPQKSGR